MRKFLLIFALVFLPLQVFAISDSDLNAVNNDTVFYDETPICANSTSVATAGNNSLPDTVPAPYHDIFINAANKNGAPAALIAAIFFAGEHGHSWPDPPPPYGNGGAWASSGVGANGGAKGPFQFEDATWNGYKDDGNGDGNMDVQDLSDAAFGASKYLAANGGTAGAPDGPIGEPSISNAIFNYNHSKTYVATVLEAYHGFLSGGTGASGGTAQGDPCGGNVGVGADGFVFPQKTTKSQLAGQKPYAWNPNCVNKVSQMGPGQMDGLCHHDYLAADIFNDTGVPVVSPRPGRVISAKDSGSVGMAVRIYSDPALGGDGLWYLIEHMLKAAEGAQGPNGGLYVSTGDTVTAGQQLGEVGTEADAQGTEQHTHFDVSPVENGFHRNYDGTAGPLLDPMPALKAAWQALPD